MDDDDDEDEEEEEEEEEEDDEVDEKDVDDDEVEDDGAEGGRTIADKALTNSVAVTVIEVPSSLYVSQLMRIWRKSNSKAST